MSCLREHGRPKVPVRRLSPCKSTKTEAHCPGFPFLCVAVSLGELLADELACGARRTAVAAQRKALSEQVQLVPFERKTALVGVQSGLTMAIANPSSDIMMNLAAASDLLLNKAGADLNYINRMAEFDAKKKLNL